EGVTEAWQIGKRGDRLDEAVSHLDAAGTERELAEVQSEIGGTADRPDLHATADALQQQLAAAQRLQGTARETRDKLRRLVAELDEAVARAIELSLKADDVADVGSLGEDIDGVVGELESLRQALDETSGTRSSPS